ncbi:MAG: hypothetical protein HY698_14030 [Deltaproteobacteria bacterium]|nr:hypothetical protein [Deltaproteobacteria bacterium]
MTRGARLVANVALVLGLACAGEGGVRIRIDAPVDPTLSPLDERVATVALLTEEEGQLLQLATRPAGDRSSSLGLGEIRVGEGVRLALQVLSPTGRMLGHGRATGPVEVSAERVSEVPIRLRRPLAFVAGAFDLRAFDTTLDPGEPMERGIAVGSFPVAVAPTPDGGELVVIAAERLHLLSTSNHKPLENAKVSLAAGARDVAVSPDSRWALVTHDAGLSVVDLSSPREGHETKPTFLPLGRVGGVAVDNNVGYVLIDKAEAGSCAGRSSIQPVPLPVPETLPSPIELDMGVNDLAVDPSSGRLLLGAACLGLRLLSPSSGGQATLELLAMEMPTVVAIQGRRAWAAGQVPGPNAHLVLASIGLDGGGKQVLDLPVPEERAKSNELRLSQEGQVAEIRMTADWVMAYDLAVLPGGAHVAILVHAKYRAETSGQVFGMPIIPQMDVETREYQLVDTKAGVPIQRMRAACDISLTGIAILSDFECTLTPGQDVARPPYNPTHVAVLFGER